MKRNVAGQFKLPVYILLLIYIHIVKKFPPPPSSTYKEYRGWFDQVVVYIIIECIVTLYVLLSTVQYHYLTDMDAMEFISLVQYHLVFHFLFIFTYKKKSVQYFCCYKKVLFLLDKMCG